MRNFFSRAATWHFVCGLTVATFRHRASRRVMRVIVFAFSFVATVRAFQLPANVFEPPEQIRRELNLPPTRRLQT